MSTKCRLCLSYCAPSAIETENLRRVIDKVFYFKIFRSQDNPTLVCEACKETVDGFYEYAESVWKNQQFLRDSLVPSTSNTVQIITKLEVDPHLGNFPTEQDEEVKVEEQDDEDAYPVEVETYLEANYESEDDTLEEDGKVLVETNRVWMTEKDDDVADESYEPEGTDGDSNDNLEESENAEDDYERAPKRKYRQSIKVEKIVTSPKSDLEVQLLQHYKLSCDLCSEPLAGFSELMKHFRQIHNQQGYLKCCNKKIVKKCWMIEHMQVHLNPDTFHCAICKKSYSSSRVLKEHTKEVHTPNDQRAIKCDTCLKPFATQRALGAHLMVAHGTVPCPMCSKVLASQGSLKKHLVMMHGEGEQFVCDFCAKVFRSKPCFDKHVKIHLGTFEVERVQCDVCSAWLTNKYCLRQHMRRIHTTVDEMVSCEVCGRPQRNKVMLRLHMARAHGESRFECDICHKKFKRSHHMREHKAIHHTGEDLYGCDYCPERFNNKNKQCLHRKTCHPVEFEEEMRKRAMKDM